MILNLRKKQMKLDSLFTHDTVRRDFQIRCPEFSPEQQEYIFSSKRETMFSGSKGSGKTFALVWRSGILAVKYKKSVTLFGAYTSKMIKDGNMPDWHKFLAKLPTGTYTYHKGDAYIEIQGSIILLRQFDDAGKAQAANSHMVAIDESTVGIQHATYEALLGSMRNGNVQMVSMANNPDSPAHFLHKEIVADPNNNQKVVYANTESNAENLTPEFIESLKRRSESWKQRYYYGLWVSMEGSVYFEFERALHIADFEYVPNWDYYLAIDFGYAVPFACLLIAVDENGIIYLCKEYYRAEADIEEHADYIQEHFMPFNPKNAIADVENTGARKRLRKRLDLKFRHPDKAQTTGIFRVKDFLKYEHNEIKKTQIHPSCKLFVEEMESYEWKVYPDGQVNKEEPKEGNDHGLDAWRYFVQTTYPFKELK